MDLKKITAEIADDLDFLKTFTATPGNGCTRMPFTRETRDAAEYLKKIMKEAGLEVREDCVGNVFHALWQDLIMILYTTEEIMTELPASSVQ